MHLSIYLKYKKNYNFDEFQALYGVKLSYASLNLSEKSGTGWTN